MTIKRQLANVNRMSISFPASVFKVLSGYADKAGMSLSQVVRLAVYEYFTKLGLLAKK